MCVTEHSLDFNSIKVRFKPIVLGNIISLFTSRFTSTKLRFFIEKMSMGNNVFFMFCDNHLYLLVLQHVKDQNKV